MRARVRLRLVTALWLACQAAIVALSPLPSCRDHGPAWGMDVAASHTAHACPMHRAQADAGVHSGHHATTDDGPSMRCRCIASGSSLAVLIMGSGLVNAPFLLPFTAASWQVPPVRHDTLSQHPTLDTPPPRHLSAA